ncbi:NAD(P)H-hydrate dehydratase [Oscillatoria laete-virens NRMC-F 0139]|nr:NAD(P)H-hydrate dehydratase [Oscillatoria laete-virens]MDL5054824.1 NAD(P)H-hydrate dehydratase [Oscillatoria laete-virens NRMC-F 0139]
MKLLSPDQIRSLENAEIDAGISSEQLMETAASNIAHLLLREFHHFGEKLAHTHVFLIGKGNNAGDGLVAARILAQQGETVVVNLVFPEEQLAELPRKKLRELESSPHSGMVTVIKNPDDFFWPSENGVVIDAILGIGGDGPLRDPVAKVIALSNQKKAERYFRTVALDVPSGLSSLDDTTQSPLAFEADLTVTIGFPKHILAREEFSHWVGRIEVAPLFESQPDLESDELITPSDLKPMARFRSPLSHKNDYGRVLVIGGSFGMSGAPVMSAHAALRAGAGLVQIATHKEVVEQVAARAWPEVMIESIENASAIEHALEKASVVVIGPGLGKSDFSRNLLAEVLVLTPVPVIIDADALNLLAKNIKFLETCPQPVILTPHPGEMSRLLGEKPFAEKDRPDIATQFAEEHQCTVILKGTRTVIASPGRPRYYNSTGNAGMATGGSGDCLCGIIASLIARGLNPCDAARLAVWWHGKAADLAARQRGCLEGMLPQDVIEWLGAALLHLRQAD